MGLLPKYRIVFMPIHKDLEMGGVVEDLESELPSPNDLEILKAIGTDEDTENLSFQGIRRKLGMHQETLSRALHRLQRDGFIERLDHAYTVSQKGQNTISSFQREIERAEPKDLYSVVLLQSVLPEDLNIQSLVDSLSYKWFGDLRWLGSSKKPGLTTLSWITSETGVRISVRIREDTLTIETYPRSSLSISEASRSAFELFDHVTRALRSAERNEISRFSRAS